MIIVTLFTLKGMLRRSIKSIKAMLLCIVYGVLYVDSVDMNIKTHDALNAARFIRYVACIGSGDPVRVLRLYTTNTLDIL